MPEVPHLWGRGAEFGAIGCGRRARHVVGGLAAGGSRETVLMACVYRDDVADIASGVPRSKRWGVAE